MMFKSLVWLAALLAVLLGGCGPAVKVAPVSGVITLDGKPLANAHIVFQPQSTTRNTEPGSFAFTDPNGAYALKLADGEQPGAVLGKHRVEINLVTASDDRDPKLRGPQKALPAKYNRNTELSFDVVAGGTNKANFDLKSQ